MANDFKHDVCLIRGAKDEAVVQAIAERLRKDGLRVRPFTPERPREGGFDEWVLNAGDSIPIKFAIKFGSGRQRALGCHKTGE